MFILADSGQGGYQFRDGGTHGDDGYADDLFRYAQLMGQSDTAIYHKAGTDKDGSGTAWRIHADEEPIQPFLLIQQCIQEIRIFCVLPSLRNRPSPAALIGPSILRMAMTFFSFFHNFFIFQTYMVPPLAVFYFIIPES